MDVVILAGGRAERLGGQDKSALRLGGRSLLDRLLEWIGPGGAVPVAGRIVMVGECAVPRGVAQTVEDPPHGGPVAGIAAGLAMLDALASEAGGAPAEWVFVVAVDQPQAGEVVTILGAAVAGGQAGSVVNSQGQLVGWDEVDAVLPDPAGGRPQWLLAAYRRAALDAALTTLPQLRHTSVRRLVADLNWGEVAVSAEKLGDVDTRDDLRAWERRLDG